MAGAGRIARAFGDAELVARLAEQATPPVIRAYHGSPYDWNRVDMSMVGKGEGPLDEGFGFYASAQPGMADWYRSHTTFLRRQAIADQLREVRSGLRATPYTDPQWHQKYRRALQLAPDVQRQRSALQREFPRGRSYELEVGYPRESLLEYDVPLYSQRPEVLERLRGVSQDLFNELVVLPDADGAMFYNKLAGWTPRQDPSIRGQRAASESLFNAGIPGHAYGGRSEKYVFYPGTEDSIRILRKYGLLGPAAAGAMQQDDSP